MKPGTPSFFIMFYVFFFVFSFLFIYTPMEVVRPVGMFVYTAVYKLAVDGAVFDTHEKKSMVQVSYGRGIRKGTQDSLLAWRAASLLLGRLLLLY